MMKEEEDKHLEATGHKQKGALRGNLLVKEGYFGKLAFGIYFFSHVVDS